MLGSRVVMIMQMMKPQTQTLGDSQLENRERWKDDVSVQTSPRTADP